jgi:release factor glutamine methyltransferase
MKPLPHAEDASLAMWYEFIVSSIADEVEQREKQNIARELFFRLFGFNRLDLSLHSTTVLSKTQIDLLLGAAQRLSQNEPVQHITGLASFGELDLVVNPHVLIPRPETEELVDLVIAKLPPNAKVLDIGTGSGCIPCLLKFKRPDLIIHAWDISSEALEIAGRNADKYGLTISFAQMDALSDWPLSFRDFDLVISNPPYIPLLEAGSLEESVLKYEPHLALFAPESDSLAFYRKIAQNASAYLRHTGFIALELHTDLAEEVMELFLNYREVRIFHDLQGRKRFLLAHSAQ